jgi:riboflavin kinase/FMN adenylyltransferase
MDILRRIEDLAPGTPSVVTVGVFDGVHLGHQAIMRQVRSSAQELGVRSVAVTFDRNPQELVNPSHPVPYITTLRRKLSLIEEQGMDIALVLPLERKLLDMPAERFVTGILHERLRAMRLVVGCNFRFGKGRAGNVHLLEKMGREMGFEVTSVSPVMADGRTVSSTAIRRLLIEGKIELANWMLGHPFSLEGIVAAGEEIGRTLGYPTANIQPAEKQIVPGKGVYAVRTPFGDGVANIGTRPTVGGEHISIEVYIFDFSGNIYGRELEVDFLHRLRDEAKFPDAEALKKQIEADIRQAKHLIGRGGCNRR